MSEAATNDPVLGYVDGLSQTTDRRSEGETASVEENQSWVSFRLHPGVFALPVEMVQEVLRVGAITRVPHAAVGVRGVTNMRGRVLPVLDLRVRLGFEASQVDERSRILVVPGGSGPVGLLVDQVDQMLSVAPSFLQEVPDRLETVARFALGVVATKDDLLVLLDLEPLLELAAT